MIHTIEQTHVQIYSYRDKGKCEQVYYVRNCHVPSLGYVDTKIVENEGLQWWCWYFFRCETSAPILIYIIRKIVQYMVRSQRACVLHTLLRSKQIDKGQHEHLGQRHGLLSTRLLEESRREPCPFSKPCVTFPIQQSKFDTYIRDL